MRRIILLALLAALAIACDHQSKPAPVVENVRVFAPLPGRSESVAYLDIQNPGNSPVSLVGVSSTAFARAEIHETSIVDGIARMQMLGTAQIDAQSQLDFVPGGMHIMLLEPRQALLPGANVQIELQFDDGTVLLLDAPVMTRMGAQNE